MILDQRTARMAPDVEKVTSVQQRCLLGSNLFKDGINKFDFLKKEKNPTKQAAQNVMSNGLPRLSNCKIPFKMVAVMGSFWHVLSPFFLLKPFRTESKKPVICQRVGVSRFHMQQSDHI